MPNLGFDIGGTNLRVLRLNDDGSSSALQQQQHPNEPEAIISIVVKLARTLIRETTESIKTIGVGCAGHVLPTGVIKSSPNLPNFIDFPLKQILEEEIQTQVLVENDANCSAWAEYQIGAGVGIENLLVISFGTGIGAGLILGGSIFRGSYGLAGEVGHMTLEENGRPCPCGNYGCWEQYSSGAELSNLISRDETHAVPYENTLTEFSEKVAVGFRNLSHVLDPEMIIVTGGITSIGDPLLDAIQQAYYKRVGHRDNGKLTQIRLGMFGNEAGALGAALMASAQERINRDL
ncbi:MAG: ROK family protein [Actinomycetota bacterium]|nr:ROK family protein [Actinomycetota bacterium]